MQFIGKIQDEYEQLWKYIIRPTRSSYPESFLGPLNFNLEGK